MESPGMTSNTADTAEMALRLVQGGSQPAEIRIDATEQKLAEEVRGLLDGLLDAAAKHGRQVRPRRARADTQGARKLGCGAGSRPTTKGRPVTVAPTAKPGSAEVVLGPRLVRGSSASSAVAPLAQADSDETLIRLWLSGRSPRTVRAYEADARAFLTHAGVPLRAATVGHVQAFGESMAGSSSATRARKLSSVKSLLSYAHRLGYVAFNVGAPVRLPPIKATLAERIVSEADVQRLLALEPDRRNRALLTLLYVAGLRVSEAVGLRWRDLAARDDAGQVTVFGKGGKTRVVLLRPGTWRMLVELRAGADADGPVFRSAKGGHLDPSQAHRLVKAAARRAGVSPALSAHWLRHAHASHALDRGAPVHLVQATLGHASVATTGRYLHARPTDSSAKYLPG
jgi:site-specific recombinase XerD